MNGDISFMSTTFDTIVEVEIITTKTADSKIEIVGLKEYETGTSFSDYKTQPILKDDGNLHLNDEILFGTIGFLKNDSISYKVDRTVGLTTSYSTIIGTKL